MSDTSACLSNTDRLKQLLLDMAQERSVERLLSLVTQRLADEAGVALVRIWLTGPGDVCPGCVMRQECQDQTTCLHLVASAGRSICHDASWSGIDGAFRRFPFGVRKVGRIAATGQPLEVRDISQRPELLADADWAREENIRAFGGQPLVYRGDILGVLAVFTRAHLGDDNLSWIRMIADHAAAAIANARAFEEIARLKELREQERDYLRDEVLQAHAFGDIVGASPALQNVLQQVSLVAPTDANVLILGESGTGKELIAREIHRRSQRVQQSLVRCNCASVPGELYESEFFGHVKGAFTGAVQRRAGRFELADQGTLFLDEVGEIPLALQSKLLRVLQDGEFEAVGDDRTRQVDVRVVAATNRDLKVEVEKHRFREDLYYRLNVFPIVISPLRERRDDIPMLAAHFVQQSAQQLRRDPPRLTQQNVRDLRKYHWPGNVRELQNVIERAVITSTSGRLDFNLPPSAEQPVPASEQEAGGVTDRILTDAEMKQRERQNLVAALRKTRWRIGGPHGAAALLGIKPTTLASRMKKMQIERPV